MLKAHVGRYRRFNVANTSSELLLCLCRLYSIHKVVFLRGGDFLTALALVINLFYYPTCLISALKTLPSCTWLFHPMLRLFLFHASLLVAYLLVSARGRPFERFTTRRLPAGCRRCGVVKKTSRLSLSHVQFGSFWHSWFSRRRVLASRPAEGCCVISRMLSACCPLEGKKQPGAPSCPQAA